MPDHRNPLFGKRKYLVGLIVVSMIGLVCAAFSMADSNDFVAARREVLLRRIGHEVLLQSGDSTSRVLPVKKMADNEYQLSFDQAFTFQPDSLVNITRRLLANDPLASGYVVNVLNCGDAGIAYAYAISGNEKDDIVSCIGRVQPRGCYRINIQFEPTGMRTAKKGYLLGGVAFLALAGFLFWRTAKPPGAMPANPPTSAGDSPAALQHQSANLFTLGSVLFDANNRKLTIHEHTIDLTGTESRLLRIFALTPNEVIERSRLQKEIWEDEGVIVGRSLDMFISKLRKKLEPDPGIKIAVVRGKGYKLEINA